jgi:hypothetical protein
MIESVLQQYRRAYDSLDARSAHAVWPTVDQTALERAFGGLRSQSLTFDECSVRVDGVVATATCRGSAEYVPKVGSSEAQVEPRVWTFTLRKAGGSWRIEAARARR